MAPSRHFATESVSVRLKVAPAGYQDLAVATVLALPAVAPAPALDRDQLYAIWAVARAEANLAYDAWIDFPGAETYAIYRAAEDRADAAQDALAEPQAPAAPLAVAA